MKTKLFIISLLSIVILPTIALGGSLTSSLIQGKSPAESINILASQIDAIFGRVEHVESQQIQSSEEISAAQIEIERLKLENENLKLKTDKLDFETAGVRAEKNRHDRCAELAKQISSNEKAVTAPYLERIKPLQSEYNRLRAIATGRDSDYYVDLNALRTNNSDENIKIDNLIIERGRQIQKEAELKQKEIQSIYQEMEDAIKESRNTPKMKPIIEEAKELLCA